MYAYCRKLHPVTGDVVFDDSRSSWAEGHPGLEIAARCLRTPKGTAQRDMTYGIDLEGIDWSSDSVASAVEQRIRDALARFVAKRIFTIENVEVEIVDEGAIWRVEIRDPRDGSLHFTEGKS
jgi:hypothetical protein